MSDQESMLDRTQRLLREHRKSSTLREIAEEAGVGYQWLTKFACQRIPDPGVTRVQALHDFLRERSV